MELMQNAGGNGLPLREALIMALAGTVAKAGTGGSPVGDMVEAVMTVLHERGEVITEGPRAVEAHQAASTFALELVFARLTCQIIRRMVLGGFILPETPQAMEWLKAYIDGNGHGPVGKPMLWPDGLLGLGALLRELGFEPTDTNPMFVRKARIGIKLEPTVPL